MKQEYAIEETEGVLRGYIPSPTEIENYAEKAGLKLERTIFYETSTQRPRIIYVLNH